MLRSETAAQPERMQRALKGLRLYQEAERRPPPPPMPVIGESHGAQLRDYGGSGEAVLFVPSLINPPNILDLSIDRSLLRWLAARGHHVMMLDWGTDTMRRRELSVAGHVEQVLLPLLRTLGEPPHLIGYCLGGTMAVAAAALGPVRSLTTLAAPWRFAGFDDRARTLLASLWQQAQPSVERLGLLPMEVLQAAFWSLDPARTIGKFEAFPDLRGEDAAAFVTLEDWANDGPPLSQAAARELFESFFAEDVTGTTRWTIADRVIDPATLSVPMLHMLSATDRIVPLASGISAGERREIERGHVGMIVGRGAREALWEPLDAWLSQHHAS